MLYFSRVLEGFFIGRDGPCHNLKMTRFTHYKKRFNPAEINQKSFDEKAPKPQAGAKKVEKNRRGFDMRKNFAQMRGRHVSTPSAGFPEKAIICLRCREPGHTLKECKKQENPGEASSETVKKQYCYNCGADDHTHKLCPSPFSNFAHAICFICSAKGHLASACSKNELGVYPNGGCCHYCGSIKHLARNCKPAESALNGNEVILSVATSAQVNPEADDVHEALQRIQTEKEVRKEKHEKEKERKKKKVVTF